MKYKCIKSFYAESKDEYGLTVEVLVAEGTVWDIIGWSYSSLRGRLLTLSTQTELKIFKIDSYVLNEHFERYL